MNAFVDLPLALSPVVVGLSLFLLYGRGGWFGLARRPRIEILFALPAMVLATIFVSLPFVAREVVPTLREIGDEQEQAGATLGAVGWQTFWQITLPAIRWAVIYGVVLTTARCSASSAPSPSSPAASRARPRPRHCASRSASRVRPRGRVRDLVVLAVMAILVLVAMSVFKPKEEPLMAIESKASRSGSASSSRSTTSRSRSSRLADRPARPERQRQVDAAARHRRARAARHGRVLIDGEDVTACRRRRAASASSSSTTPPSST